jgi:hypothetical protein
MSNKHYLSINYGPLPDPSKHYDLLPGGFAPESHHGYEVIPSQKKDSPYGVMPTVTTHLPARLEFRKPIAQAVQGDYGSTREVSLLRENPYGVAVPLSKNSHMNMAVRGEPTQYTQIPARPPVTVKLKKSMLEEPAISKSAAEKPRIPKRVLSPEEMQQRHKHIDSVTEKLQQFNEGLKKENIKPEQMPKLRERLQNILSDVGRLRGVLNQEKFSQVKSKMTNLLASIHAKMRGLEKLFATPKKETVVKQEPSRVQHKR